MGSTGLAWVLSLFRKRIRAVLPLAIAAIALVGLARSRLPETYTCSFEVRFAETNLPARLGETAARLGLKTGVDLETQAQVVRSRPVVLRAVEGLPFVLPKTGPKGRARIADAIAAGIEVTSSSKPPTLTVRVRWGSPEECLDIAKAVLSAYGKQETAAKEERDRAAQERLENHREWLDATIQDSQDLISASTRIEARKQQMAELESRLGALDRETSAYVDRLRADRAAMATTYAPDWPGLAELDARIAALEHLARVAPAEELDAAATPAPASPLAGVPPRDLGVFVERRKARLAIEGELARLREEQRAAEADLAAKLGADRTVRDVELELQRVKAQFDEVQATLRNLRDARERVAAPFEIAREPSLPLRPDSPTLLEISAIGLAAFLGMALLCVLVLERIDPIVRTLHDLRRDAPAEVLATVPYVLPVGAAEDSTLPPCPLLFGEEATHPAAEAFRICAANTLAMLEQAPPGKCLLLVTSPADQGGTSTVALNLACAFADKGSKTLLVDANLRRPTLAGVFGIPPAPGVVEALSGKVAWSEAVAQSVLPRLHVLPAGATAPDAFLLLGSPKVLELLQAVSEGYDVVLLDASPVLPVTDSLLLAPRMDGIVLVASLGVIVKGDLARCIQLLARSKGRVLGVVANQPSGYRGTFRK